MSLDTVCVKTEEEKVCVKQETEEECDNEEPGVHVKEESDCKDSVGLCDLYAGHQIKDELVLGPEELHRPCVPSTLPARRSCRVGLHTYTLRRTREPRHYTAAASAGYQCDQCAGHFTDKPALRKHIRTHSSEPSTGFNKSALAATLKRVKEARGRACSVRLERLLVDAERRSCRVGLHTYTLRRTREPRHYTAAASAGYQCDQCAGHFTDKPALRKHIHTHLSEHSEPSTYFEKFALPATLKRVKEARGRACSVRRLVGAEQTHVGGKLFQCSDCDYQCNSNSGLWDHQRRKHTGEKTLKCNHCDYKCRRKNNLKRHEKIHTGEKPFRCSLCDYKCRHKYELKCHEKIHTDEKPFKCSLCDYKCRQIDYLKSHEKIHTYEKPFKCSLCDYKCRRKDYLKSHEKIHTYEKPFKCSLCDYKCRRKDALKSHEKIHTGEKPFRCSHCDYKCRHKTELKCHEKIHTDEKPFKCSLCDYKCRRKDYLKSHEKIHTYEKPFKCSLCDYKCRRKYELKCHERLHTGENLFKCSHCDYKCRQKKYLVTHQRMHTR